MKRVMLPLALLLAASVALAGCCEQKVKVKTGDRVVCTYGETISDNVKEIEVPPEDVAKYSVKTRTITCARHRGLEALYAEAQDAIRRGDLEAAKAKLAEVVKLEENFGIAAAQLAQIEAGKTPTPDTNKPTPTSPDSGSNGGDDTPSPEVPAAKLVTWVPDNLPGYKARPISVDISGVTREYLPLQPGKIAVLVVVAEQYPTEPLAESTLKSTINSQYGSTRSDAKVEGRTLQFGTYTSRYAIVGWREGNVVVFIEAASPDGKSTELKSTLVDIAASIIP